MSGSGVGALCKKHMTESFLDLAAAQARQGQALDNVPALCFKVPNGFVVRRGALGTQLCATRDFEVGDFLYTNCRLLVNDTEGGCDVEIWVGDADTEKGQTPMKLQTHTHGVPCGKGQLWLYSFDSFVDHSCEPNTLDVHDEGSPNFFSVYAIRPIKAGDAVKQNYNLFCYDDYDFYKINRCACGAASCHGGPVRGFKYLALEEKKALASEVEPHVLELYTLDCPEEFASLVRPRLC